MYNLNRVQESNSKEIVVVEGFFDVFALWQSGIESVALMGSSMSYNQKHLLSNLEQRLTLMLMEMKQGERGCRQEYICYPGTNC